MSDAGRSYLEEQRAKALLPAASPLEVELSRLRSDNRLMKEALQVTDFECRHHIREVHQRRLEAVEASLLALMEERTGLVAKIKAFTPDAESFLLYARHR